MKLDKEVVNLFTYFTGDLVAHIKFTVLLMPNGSDRITSHPLQQLLPSKMIDDNAEIKAWMALGTKTKKKGGGKKKKGTKTFGS